VVPGIVIAFTRLSAPLERPESPASIFPSSAACHLQSRVFRTKGEILPRNMLWVGGTGLVAVASGKSRHIGEGFPAPMTRRLLETDYV